jgi:NAD+ synthetase
LANLAQSLRKYRERRGFRTSQYIQAKVALLNDYMRSSGLSACVVGVSGGVDSAVVLGLIVKASKAPGSPIKRILAALMPMASSCGATNQNIATDKGRLVCQALGVETATMDLSEPQKALQAVVDAGSSMNGTPWSVGQLVSYLRTPALYYLAALLAQEGHPALLCGTTNRDEGAYIGFFGKASDGMVDMQLISDIHKSEVREVARELGIPDGVIDAVPTGDTFDGRVDEEMIGAPYDFLEFYTGNLIGPNRFSSELESLSFDTQCAAWIENIELLHRKNLHKYLAGSPAVHLDIYPRAVPGGWRNESYPPLPADPRPTGLVGEFQLDPLPDLFGQDTQVESRSPLDFGPSARVVDQALSPQECQWLIEQYHRVSPVAVNQHGNRKDFVEGQDSVGSQRATCYGPQLADLIWSRIQGHFSEIRVMEPTSPTDWNGHRVWRAIAINPVFRFIDYPPGGWLVPHYDAGYDFKDGRRHTLMSLVVYLDANGSTRFMLDHQRHLPIEERCHDDWTRRAEPHEILADVPSLPGRILLFDHRLLHDASPWEGPGNRIIVRTDVIFERCGLQPCPVPPSSAAHKSPAPEEASLRKAKLDPYYGPALPLLKNLAGLEEAGFFEDTGDGSRDRRYASDWMVTPLHRIQENLKNTPLDSWLAVLVTTGAMCPVHPGHIEMMERAKTELEARGATVLGGYLSPSHDEYLKLKCGDGAMTADHRLYLCQQAIKNSDWLMVDPWESLHTDLAVNFTEVLERLSAYLSKHIRTQRPIQVVYVFGGDNARFSLTFVARGASICIPRQGYEERFQLYSQHPLVDGRPNMMFSNGPCIENLASSKVRQGATETLKPEVQLLWNSWKNSQPARNLVLHLRDEENWSVALWPQTQELAQARQDFMQGLRQIVTETFERTGQPVQLHNIRLSQQAVDYPQVDEGCQTISLDPCFKGDFNLGLSRCFSLADSQAYPELVARPGWPDVESQLAALPPGRYTLIDDDLATGWTKQRVLEALPEHCQVISFKQLCLLNRQQDDTDFDLADSRDFLVGSREGGLVVRLPNGQLARAPYILPYVQPVERTTIPLSSYFRFSTAIWKLNRRFFEQYNPKFRVDQSWPAFQTLAYYLGFKPETPMIELCDWHLLRLNLGE